MTLLELQELAAKLFGVPSLVEQHGEITKLYLAGDNPFVINFNDNGIINAESLASGTYSTVALSELNPDWLKWVGIKYIGPYNPTKNPIKHFVDGVQQPDEEPVEQHIPTRIIWSDLKKEGDTK